MKNKNILLIRGLTREAEHGPEFLRELKKRMPEYNIVTLDIPGNGKHFRLKSFTSIKKNVFFLRDQWKKRINYPSENVLIGISLGGMVALEWSTLFPEDWNHVVLINTSHGALSSIPRRFRLGNIFNLLKIALTKSIKRKQEIIFSMTVHNKYLKDATVNFWTQIGKLRPISPINALRQIWSAITFRKISAKTVVPTHLICSRLDKLVSYKCSEQLAKYLQLPLVIHEVAGHDPTVDDPDWLAEQISIMANAKKS
jgi:pimeloyl-ACP methyl ester carboxylesterase